MNFLALSRDIPRQQIMSKWQGEKYTNELIFVALDNCEGPWILGILHDEPRDGSLVLRVDAAGLGEFCLEVADTLLLGP